MPSSGEATGGNGGVSARDSGAGFEASFPGGVEETDDPAGVSDSQPLDATMRGVLPQARSNAHNRADEPGIHVGLDPEAGWEQGGTDGFPDALRSGTIATMVGTGEGDSLAGGVARSSEDAQSSEAADAGHDGSDTRGSAPSASASALHRRVTPAEAEREMDRMMAEAAAASLRASRPADPKLSARAAAEESGLFAREEAERLADVAKLDLAKGDAANGPPEAHSNSVETLRSSSRRLDSTGDGMSSTAVRFAAEVATMRPTYAPYVLGVLAVLVAGVAYYVMGPGSEPVGPLPAAIAKAPAASDSPSEPAVVPADAEAPDVPTDAPPSPASENPGAAVEAENVAARPDVGSKNQDPRTVPPGTSPEAAAAFTRIPVADSDRPPVGGVGATGIHVDRIAIGPKYSKAACHDPTKTFSVGKHRRANVCFRAVHAREDEEVVVLWQKGDEIIRRSQVTIKPTHSYRTRAYIALRQEFVGPWTVRIMSQDGVELASETFEIVP